MCRWGVLFVVCLDPRKTEKWASFQEAHQCSGNWRWTQSTEHNCCHIGFCEALLILWRCHIGHSQENTKFLVMDENDRGDTHSWRITHLLWKTSRMMEPSVTLSICSVPVLLSTLCLHHPSHENTYLSPSQNLNPLISL